MTAAAKKPTGKKAAGRSTKASAKSQGPARAKTPPPPEGWDRARAAAALKRLGAAPKPVAPIGHAIPVAPVGRESIIKLIGLDRACAEVLALGCSGGFSKARVARHFGVRRQTIHEWADRHPQFADALETARDFSLAHWEDVLDRNAESDISALKYKLANDFSEEYGEASGEASGQIVINVGDPYPAPIEVTAS